MGLRTGSLTGLLSTTRGLLPRIAPVLALALALVGALGVVLAGTSAGQAATLDDVRPAQPSDLVTQVHSVAVDGSTRVYQSVVPAQLDGRAPLLVVLHGRNQSLPTVVSQTGFLGLARSRRVVLAFPVGEDRSWNAGHGCCGLAGSQGLPDLTFVAAVVADAVRTLPVDATRIYLVGYSNGGKLAYSEACAHPALFAAVATYGAVPLVPCDVNAPPLPFLLAAGTADRIVPSAGAPRGHPVLPSVQEALRWLRSRDRCADDPLARPSVLGRVLVTRWTRCRAGGEVESVLYRGRGHLWPSSQAVGKAAAASTLMWSFLRRQHAGVEPVAVHASGGTSAAPVAGKALGPRGGPGAPRTGLRPRPPDVEAGRGVRTAGSARQ